MDTSYRNIWKIAFPILVGIFIQQLVGLTDTAFLGRVGEVELGASAIGGVFYITVYMVGFGFAAGAQILIGQYNGAGQQHKIGPVLYNGLWCLMIGAAAVILAVHHFGYDLFRLLLHSHQVLDATDAYLGIRIYGFFPVFIVIIFRAFYIGITDTKILTANALLMLFTNIILDYLLIFGKFGFPEMSIRGAALASVISEIVSAIFFIIYTLVKTDTSKYSLKKYMPNIKTIATIWQLSIWTTLQYFFSLSTWFLFYIAIEHRGESALAISNILRSAGSIPFMIIPALGSTMNTLAANLAGSQQYPRIMPTATKIIKLAYIVSVGIALVMALFPSATMHIFTNDHLLIDQAHYAYYAMLTINLSLIPGFIYLNVISGCGQTKASMLIEWAGISVYLLGVWLIVIHWQLSLGWCWLTEHWYNIPLWAINYWYIKKHLFRKLENSSFTNHEAVAKAL